MEDTSMLLLNANDAFTETNAADVMLRVVMNTQAILQSEPRITPSKGPRPDLILNGDTYTFYHSGTF